MRFLKVIPLLFVFVVSSAQDQFQGVDRRTSLSTELNESDFNMIFHQDLDHREPGPYGYTAWKEDWNNPPWGDGITYGDGTVILDYEGGGRSSRVMRWIFPEGSYSTTYEHGYQWRPPLNADYFECYLTYSIMFRPGFDPVLGGKMPCLMGYPFDGKPDFDDGFYAGIMFKEGSEGPKPAFYVYYQDMSGEYGATRYWDYTFDVSTEIWFDITLRVVMNTVSGGIGNYDGIIEGFVDGVLVGQWPYIRLRNYDNIGTNAAIIQGFFGGGDESFATTRDEWILIDNVSVWQYSNQFLNENPSVKRGGQLGNFGDKILTPVDLLDYSVDPVPDPTVVKDTIPPSTPKSLMAADSTQSSIMIRWNSSLDDTGVTGYFVYKKGFLFGATVSNEYVFSNLKPSTQYNFSVAAYDAAGNVSPISSAVSAYTRLLDTIPPTAPQNLRSGRITGYSVEISWNVATDNVGVASYDVYVNGGKRHSTKETLFIVPSLQPGVSYNISVTANDVSGNEGPMSNTISVLTGAQDDEAPSKPTELKKTLVTETTIGLSWKPSVDNVMVTKYKIYLNGMEWDESILNEKTIGGLEPGLPYVFAVRALDEAQNQSPLSDALGVTTKNMDITTTPTLPSISIISLEDKTINPTSVSEVSALGYVEMGYYGIEVVETEKPFDVPQIMDGLDKSVFLSNQRVGNGIQVLYIFSEGGGSTVKDWAGSSAPMDLQINLAGITTEWMNGQGLKIIDQTSISYPGTPTNLINALKQTNEITIEAWVKQEENNKNGFAHLATLFRDQDSRAVSLVHNGNEASYYYGATLNTTATSLDGSPMVTTSTFVSNSLHHVVYTRDNLGIEKIYINGLEFYSGQRTGDFSSWGDDYKFALVANEDLAVRPWRGIYYMLAVYNRAHPAEDVRKNYQAGIGYVQFTNLLNTLEVNTEYQLTPFVRTNQGTVYGDSVIYINRNVTQTDSLLIIYPNPSQGSFTLIINNKDVNIKEAALRIADFSGQIHYYDVLDLSEGLIENLFEIELPPGLATGFYSVILTTSTHSVAEKLVLIR